MVLPAGAAAHHPYPRPAEDFAAAVDDRAAAVGVRPYDDPPASDDQAVLDAVLARLPPDSRSAPPSLIAYDALLSGTRKARS